MSFLGMTRNSLGTRHCVTKKNQPRILYYHTFHFCVFIFRLVPLFCCGLFSVFIIFVFYGFSWSKVVFFGAGAFFFRSANLYSSVHPHFLDVRGINNWKKSKMAAGGMPFAGKVALITGTFWALSRILVYIIAIQMSICSFCSFSLNQSSPTVNCKVQNNPHRNPLFIEQWCLCWGF